MILGEKNGEKEKLYKKEAETIKAHQLFHPILFCCSDSLHGGAILDP